MRMQKVEKEWKSEKWKVKRIENQKNDMEEPASIVNNG